MSDHESGTMPRAPCRVDVAKLRRSAIEALERARFVVHAVPIGDGRGFTLSHEMVWAKSGGLPQEDAERYAVAVNNEAQLARAMLIVLGEFERLSSETESLRSELGRLQQTA